MISQHPRCVPSALGPLHLLLQPLWLLSVAGCISLVPLDFNFWFIFVFENVFVCPLVFFSQHRLVEHFSCMKRSGGVQEG